MNAGCNLNLPKIHSLQHYTERIILFGTPDNFDTEYTEHQHITDAKDPYRKTNKVNPVPQMVKYVERRTALQLKYQYLNSLLISEEDGDNIVSTGHQPSIGSRMPGCPIHISSVERLFRLKDLEYCLRSYLHDLSFPEREGRKHRVKKRKLPQVFNPQVFTYYLRYPIIYQGSLIHTRLNSSHSWYRLPYSEHSIFPFRIPGYLVLSTIMFAAVILTFAGIPGMIGWQYQMVMWLSRRVMPQTTEYISCN